MNHPKTSKEEMEKRVVRFTDLDKTNAIPLMFIDSMLPGHHRLNYALIGDTASENPDFSPILRQPHGFQIGMFKSMPNGNGPAYHTHDYIEIFFPLEGQWRFWYGNDEKNDSEHSINLGRWDMISFPPGLWRRFENIGQEAAWCFAVLENHKSFEGKDPYWSTTVIKKAKELGFQSDEKGKMIKPKNYEQIHAEMLERMYKA